MNSVSCFLESPDRKLRALGLGWCYMHSTPADQMVPKAHLCVSRRRLVLGPLPPRCAPRPHLMSATTMSGHTLTGPEAASDRNNDGGEKSLCVWATYKHRNTKTHLRSEKGKMERRRDL